MDGAQGVEERDMRRTQGDGRGKQRRPNPWPRVVCRHSHTRRKGKGWVGEDLRTFLHLV